MLPQSAIASDGEEPLAGPAEVLRVSFRIRHLMSAAWAPEQFLQSFSAEWGGLWEAVESLRTVYEVRLGYFSVLSLVAAPFLMITDAQSTVAREVVRLVERLEVRLKHFGEDIELGDTTQNVASSLLHVSPAFLKELTEEAARAETRAAPPT